MIQGHNNSEKAQLSSEKVAIDHNFFDRLEKLISDHANGKPYTFGRRAGIKDSTMTGYAKRKRLPEIEQALRICITYNVNLNWLLRGIGDPYLGLPARLTPDQEREDFGFRLLVKI